jgi:DMSO/TMAO reductase YedYZ molybdopterin-dependent catalytic subunit
MFLCPMSTDDDTHSDVEESRRERLLRRRRFLAAAGSVSAAGLLAGCGGQDGEGTGTETATATGTATATETETPTATPEAPEPSLAEKYPGLRILSPDPENAEAASNTTYQSVITPIDEFYIRNHYASPDIDASEWTISLTGMVDEEVELSVEELQQDYPYETVLHTMQCSGNGRSYFEPSVGGNQWSFGAVGNAEWTGVRISDILEEYGAETGSDRWLTVMGGDAPDGEDIFTRSIPMDKVMDDCLLAMEMNGEPLPAEHGYPARLLVPGWFGNNNVKWVDRMHVMDGMVYPNDTWEPGGGRLYTHWQQYSYRISGPNVDRAEFNETISEFDTQRQMESDEITHPYLYDQMVKSLVGYPEDGATIATSPAGMVEIIGVAWAGDDAVETVEVSTDGGDSWNEAEFLQPDTGTYSWRLFRYMWDASSGEHTIVSRATDEQGFTQPATVSAPDDEAASQARIMNDQYPWNSGGYGNTAYMPHAVTVTVE